MPSSLGRRIPDDSSFAEGDYGKVKGLWYCRPPGFHLGSLENHQVIEHEDGTITVSLSILYTTSDANGEIKWHGFLERGIWRWG